MSYELIRKKLERLFRSALQSRSLKGSRNPRQGYGPALSCSEQAPVRLEEIVDGREVVTPVGKFLLIDRGACQFMRSADEFVANYSYYFERGSAVISEESAPVDLVKFVECGSRKSVFLDIETTGLCGRPLFLVGLLLHRDDGLVVRQLFARDYSEERALLQYLIDFLREFQVMVTFNGKSFDIPYIRDRCSYNMLPFSLELHHFDLLHEYRRRWKEILPDCRLQTLESRICYRYREADIPGAEIPQAYHDYVRTGDARLINDILYHNAVDLITMSDLTLRLFTSEA